MEHVFYHDDVYELTHRYECEGDDTLMIAYRQPNGWRGYEIKVSDEFCEPADGRVLNKRQMLVRIGFQDDDDILDRESKRDYWDIVKQFLNEGK